MSKNRTETGAQTLAPESIEPPEPEATDEQLLVHFHSRFANSDPDGWVITPDSSKSKRRRVSELVAEERANYLKAQRQAIANQRAALTRARAEAERKTLELARARSGQSILELKTTGDAYQRWLDKEAELARELVERETILANLLANQPGAEIELEQLRAHSSEIADHQLMVNALRAQVVSWGTTKIEPLGALREATGAVGRDLTISHQAERERRVEGAEKALEALLDFDALRARAPYNAPGLRDLAACARSVVELDQAVGYSNGRYSWNHSVVDGALLAQVERLTQLHDSLALLIETA